MDTQYPLELAGRMARKSAQLFRSINHLGFALFGDIGAGAVDQARGIAQEAEREDRSATAILDDVLRDGIVTAAEIPLLRRARGKVARSAAKDAQLATGGAVS